MAVVVVNNYGGYFIEAMMDSNVMDSNLQTKRYQIRDIFPSTLDKQIDDLTKIALKVYKLINK